MKKEKPKYRIDNKKLKRLVERAQKGNEEALEQIVTEASRYIYFYSLMMLQNPETAQDAVQDVLLTLLQKIDTIKNPAFFLSWIKIVTANYCKNKLTREHKNYSLDEDYDVIDLSDQINPERTVEDNEFRSLILSIIKDLPPSQRECVMMFYYEQLTTREIAEALSVSENTVKSRLRYARDAIRKRLEAYDKNNLLLGAAPMSLISHILISEAEKQPCLVIPDTALRHSIFIASIKSSVCGASVPVKVAAVACSAIAALGGITTVAVSGMYDTNSKETTQSVETYSDTPAAKHHISKTKSSKAFDTKNDYSFVNDSNTEDNRKTSVVNETELNKETNNPQKKNYPKKNSEPTIESTSESTESTFVTEEASDSSEASSSENVKMLTKPSETTESDTTENTDPNAPTHNETKVVLKAGSTFTFKVYGGNVKTVKELGHVNANANKIATINKTTLTLTALTSGITSVKFILQDGTSLTAKVYVNDKPKLSKETVTVKKGKTATVKVINKAKSIDNAYDNTEYAKIISTKDSAKLTVKGFKKGNTTLKITVNGVALKLKVKVK